MANQWDLLGQVVVEGAAEEQVVEEGDAVVWAVGEGAAVVQVDLGAVDLADLEAVVEVHYEDQQGGLSLFLLSPLSFTLSAGLSGASTAGPSIFSWKIVKLTYLVLEYLFCR